jgi:hypothetical protein
MASGDDKTTPSGKPGYRSARNLIETQRAAERVATRLRDTLPDWLKDPDIWAEARADVEKEEEERAKARAGQPRPNPHPTPEPPSAPAPAPPDAKTPTPEPVSSSTELSEPKLSPSAQWCRDRVVALKAAKEIRAGIRISDLARRLKDELLVAADEDNTLAPLKWQSIKNGLPEWGVWPLVE